MYVCGRECVAARCHTHKNRCIEIHHSSGSQTVARDPLGIVSAKIAEPQPQSV